MPVTPPLGNDLLAETEKGSSPSSLADTSDEHKKNLQNLKLKLLIKQLRKSRVITVGVVFILTCLISAGMIEIYLRCLFKDGVITLNHQSLLNIERDGYGNGNWNGNEHNGNGNDNGKEDEEESVWETESDSDQELNLPGDLSPLPLLSPSGIRIRNSFTQRRNAEERKKDTGGISVHDNQADPENAVNASEHVTADEITSPVTISLADPPSEHEQGEAERMADGAASLAEIGDVDEEDSENETTFTDIADSQGTEADEFAEFQGTEVDDTYEPRSSVVGAISGHQITDVGGSIYESQVTELDESQGTEVDDNYERRNVLVDEFSESHITALIEDPKVAVTGVSRAADFVALTAVGPLEQATTEDATNLSADPLSDHRQEAAERMVDNETVSLAGIDDFDEEDSKMLTVIYEPQSTVVDTISETHSSVVDAIADPKIIATYESQKTAKDAIYEPQNSIIADLHSITMIAEPKLAVTGVFRAVDFVTLSAVEPPELTATDGVTDAAAIASMYPNSDHVQEAAKTMADTETDFDEEHSRKIAGVARIGGFRSVHFSSEALEFGKFKSGGVSLYSQADRRPYLHCEVFKNSTDNTPYPGLFHRSSKPPSLTKSSATFIQEQAAAAEEAPVPKVVGVAVPTVYLRLNLPAGSSEISHATSADVVDYYIDFVLDFDALNDLRVQDKAAYDAFGREFKAFWASVIELALANSDYSNQAIKDDLKEYKADLRSVKDLEGYRSFVQWWSVICGRNKTRFPSAGAKLKTRAPTFPTISIDDFSSQLDQYRDASGKLRPFPLFFIDREDLACQNIVEELSQLINLIAALEMLIRRQPAILTNRPDNVLDGNVKELQYCVDYYNDLVAKMSPEIVSIVTHSSVAIVNDCTCTF